MECRENPNVMKFQLTNSLSNFSYLGLPQSLPFFSEWNSFGAKRELEAWFFSCQFTLPHVKFFVLNKRIV